jgi:hypothetical protein
MPKWIMVLADGDTYSQLDGCAIVAIPEDMQDEEIEEFVRHSDGWYCFDDKPTELEPNNGQTSDDLRKMDLDYYRENWVRIQSITTPWGPRKGL